MSGFGGRLKAERKRLGLSAGKFSALCGVAENAQYNYEKETRSPDSDYLEKAAEAGVDVLFLITGQKMTATLPSEQLKLLSAYAAATPALRSAALAVLESGAVVAPAQIFQGPITGGVAGRDIVNAGGKGKA